MKTKLEIKETEALWKKYKKTLRHEYRNKLIENYLPLVKSIAERLSLHLPDFVCVDDLISMGTMGLFAAVKSFNIDRGVRFETYCASRIRGAMIDGLREADWVPRLVRMKSNHLEKTVRRLENQLGRKANDAEVVQRLGVSINEYNELVNESVATSILHFSCKDDDEDTNMSTSNLIEDHRSENDFNAFLNNQVINFINKNLSKKERHILEMYFFEEMTMDEIGHVLDITESRVSQILNNLMKRLKTILGKYKHEWLS